MIRSWSDLNEFGIRALTGEACALSCRLLCDLTDQGQSLIREFMGLPHDAKFTDNWNSGATGSCFLPLSILPDLAAFCLIKSGCWLVIHAHDEIYGFSDEPDEILLTKWLQFNQSHIRAEFDSNGLCDLAINGRTVDCDATELSAIARDSLKSRLPKDHSCYAVAVGQFR